MTIKKSPYISLSRAAIALNLSENDGLEILFKNNLRMLIKKQLPAEIKNSQIQKTYHKFGSGVVTEFWLLSNFYKFSHQDVLSILCDEFPSPQAIEVMQQLIDAEIVNKQDNTKLHQCTKCEASSHIRKLMDKYGEKNGECGLIRRIKEMKLSGISADEILKKFSYTSKKKSSDIVFWQHVEIWSNFDLISVEEIQELEQTLEEPYWELGFGYDICDRNYISDLVVNKEIAGSREKPILLILPGGSYCGSGEDSFSWYFKESIILENVYFYYDEFLEFFDLYKDSGIDAEIYPIYIDNKHMNDSKQPLSRYAIKQTYSKIENWKYYFDNEKYNKLFDCRLKQKQGNKVMYDRTLFHKWLIANGHYSDKELKRLMGETAITSNFI